MIITKAGPGTISEALICGLPMVLNAFVPCQEEGNIPYVTQNKARPACCAAAAPRALHRCTSHRTNERGLRCCSNPCLLVTSVFSYPHHLPCRWACLRRAPSARQRWVQPAGLLQLSVPALNCRCHPPLCGSASAPQALFVNLLSFQL